MSKFRDAVAKAAADKMAARDDRSRQQAENAEAAGRLVTSGVFGAIAAKSGRSRAFPRPRSCS